MRANGFGGVVVRQSDLSSWSRCQLQKHYLVQAEEDPGFPQPERLSATEFGTVMHYALMIMEKLHHEGRPDALRVATATFEKYWHPDNIEQIARRVTRWLPKQTYGGLLERGRIALAAYYESLTAARGRLLALEYQWAIPVEISGRVHTLTGTIDRLSIGYYRSRPYIEIGDYKGLALDTPLPTPTGWTTMGDVRVGDLLIGSDGTPTSVVGKSEVHDKPCYRIMFDDGTEIVCDEDHLWTTVSDAGEAVRSVKEIDSTLFSPRGQRQHRIPNAEPMILPEADLPIHPYVLGCWLGDGKHTSGEICKPDDDLFSNIEACGFRVSHRYPTTPAHPVGGRTVLGLRTLLREQGLLGDKHVPREYLRASLRQRLDLLRGLMDTDGSWHRSRRRAVFTSCDERLAEAVAELAASLGWRPTTFKVKRTGFGLTVDAWDVTFSPVTYNPFRLSRKADLVDTLAPGDGAKARRRLVVSVEAVDSVPTQCVQVDSDDSMYLCGKQMIPTHNSGRQPTYLRYNLQGTVYSWASTQREFWSGPPEGTLPGVEFESFPEGVVRELELYFASWRFSLIEGGLHPLASRRFRWINLMEAKSADGGWRTRRDYERMFLSIDAYIRANEAGIYSPTATGEVCQYCAFRDVCGGIGLDPEGLGAPL